jgi:hypothetical protein
MKRKSIAFAGAFALLIGVGVAFVANQNSKSESLSLLQQNIEVLADGESIWDQIEDWWDSEVYDCIEVHVWKWDCKPYSAIAPAANEWQVGGPFAPDEICCGYFQVLSTDCVGGNTVAHCWDC